MNFLCRVKGGGLRLCFDYRGINNITVKYLYPLPLFPAALEQLRTGCVFFFIKLDSRTTYILIHTRAGHKWKMTFSMTLGQYQYQVMHFGLASMLLLFQCFINDMLRDYRGRVIITYIDNILTYL